MKKYIIALAIAIISLSGCEKFLDKRDPTATSFDEFFTTEEDIRRVVYSSFLDAFTHPTERRLLFYMMEGRSDNAYARIETDHHMIIANGNLTSNSRASEYYWTLFMKHIGRINTYLENIDIPYVENASTRQRYKAILEGLRIWHYFRTTYYWGDIPFVLVPVNLEESTPPLTPQAEVLDKLFEMSEDVASRLPEDEGTTNVYMFNKYSFKSVVMRYALYFGRYELAARLAKEIIDSREYQLNAKYGDLFNYKADKTNKEFIVKFDMESHANSATQSFEHMAPQYRTGRGQSYCVPTKALVDAYWTAQGRPIDQCPLHTKAEYELNPKLNRDPRLAVSIFGNGDLLNNEKIDVYDSKSIFYYQNLRSSRTGYWFKKYVDEADLFRTGGNMHFGLTRYAEVLLTYAEAKIMLDDIDELAKSCINQVRQRAGLDMTIADVTLSSKTRQEWIALLRNERRIEFAGEGLRYDDLLRWKIAETALNQPVLGHTRMLNGNRESLKVEDRRFLNHQYKWPFHESSLSTEPNLIQNPGY